LNDALQVLWNFDGFDWKFRFFRIDLGSLWLFECESVKIEFCYFICSICFAFPIGIGSNSKLLKVVIFRYFIIWSQFYSI
jgi:hypothetical protein